MAPKSVTMTLNKVKSMCDCSRGLVYLMKFAWYLVLLLEGACYSKESTIWWLVPRAWRRRGWQALSVLLGQTMIIHKFPPFYNSESYFLIQNRNLYSFQKNSLVKFNKNFRPDCRQRKSPLLFPHQGAALPNGKTGPASFPALLSP